MHLLKFTLVIFSLLQITALQAKQKISAPPPPKYLYVDECYDIGMFAEFNFITGILYEFDMNPTKYSGVEINFKKTGLYYVPDHGENWWNYFCEPICIGKPKGTKVKYFKKEDYIFDFPRYAYFIEAKLPRERVNELIQKYIRVKKPILDKVKNFVDENFTSDYIISVHYRGTDKKSEAVIISYDKIVANIKTYIFENGLDDYQIFVASDEESFVNYMKEEFPGLIISYTTMRSNDGQALHVSKFTNEYHLGEDAIIDCLLLSKGDILFRTASNLSLWSSFFNPTMPVVLIKERRNNSNTGNPKIDKNRKHHKIKRRN